MENLVGILNYLVFFAITAGIYAVLCLGLNIHWGYTGLLNIGIAGFYAVGAYTSALLSGPPPGAWDLRIFGGFELPFVVGLLGAAVVSGIIAFLIGIPTLRLREDYLAIATIGIAETIRLILKNADWLTNSVWGIKHIPSPLFDPIQSGISGFLKDYPNIELIWASHRELYNVVQANEIGCDIITATNNILRKLPTLGKDLDQFSLETVKMFYDDATEAGYSI